MKVQENEALKMLAIQANKEPKKLALEIYEHLEMWDVLDGSGEYWGYPIKDCVKSGNWIGLALCGLLIKPTDKNKEAFLSLILMLDGDCPACGGEYLIDADQSEYKIKSGDDILSPVEHEPIVEVLVCKHCGNTKLQ